MICFTPKFLEWFAIFIISFDTVSILEPNFKTFTPIRKLKYEIHFLAMLALCRVRNPSMLRQEKIYKDFICLKAAY